MLFGIASVIIEALTDLIRRRPGGRQPDAILRRPFHALRADRWNPGFRYGLLQRSRQKCDIIEIPVFAVMLEGLVRRPSLANDLPAFLEALARLRRGNIESPEIAAPRQSDDEPSVSKIVEQSELLSKSHRMMQRQTVAHQADLHLLGQHRSHRDKQVGRRRQAIRCAAVMLGKENSIEAVAFDRTKEFH